MKVMQIMDTVIGKLYCVQEEDALVAISYFKPSDLIIEQSTPLLTQTKRELAEYFQQTRTSFNIKLKLVGTPFQIKVWEALQTIPYGETRSYKQIAEAIGCSKGCRAVGMANHHNPISILVPCHRVIGTNGKLVGYAGGTQIKENLLQIEKSRSG